MTKASRPRRSRVADATREPAEGIDVRRGDVLWINCDPFVGAEPRKTRTCVVVSNDIANHHGGAITVVPTQEYDPERAARAYMADLRRPRSTLESERVANASMIMTYDRRRIVSRAGRVGADAMKQIERALGVHLGLLPA